MRTGSSDNLFQGHRSRNRLATRLKSSRRSRYCLMDLEGLESRTLLATIPAVAPATIDNSPLTPMNLTSFTNATSGGDGNATSPVVAINPYDSQEVVAVWEEDISNETPVPLTTSIMRGAFSLNGGSTWTALPNDGFQGIGFVHPDPALYTPTAPTPPYLLVTDASIGFDSQGNFYVLDTQHNAGAIPTSGAVTLSKYSFVGNSTAGGTGVTVDFSSQIIDQWVNGPADMDAVVAVDAGTYPNSTATSTPPAGVPQDPNVNKVYIAWATNDVHPADPLVLPVFSANRAELLVSSNGGASFGGETFPDPIGNGPAPGATTELDTHPQLAINSSDSGAVTVVWTNIGSVVASPAVSATRVEFHFPRHFILVYADPYLDRAHRCAHQRNRSQGQLGGRDLPGGASQQHCNS